MKACGLLRVLFKWRWASSHCQDRRPQTTTACHVNGLVGSPRLFITSPWRGHAGFCLRASLPPFRKSPLDVTNWSWETGFFFFLMSQGLMNNVRKKPLIKQNGSGIMQPAVCCRAISFPHTKVTSPLCKWKSARQKRRLTLWRSPLSDNGCAHISIIIFFVVLRSSPKIKKKKTQHECEL